MTLAARTHSLARRIGPTLLAAGVLVVGADLTAYAAGHPLVLGTTNTERHVTTLTSDAHGPALALHTAKTAPPLTVTSTRKVTHLNADRVDGRDAADLGTGGTRFELSDGAGVYDLNGVRAGTYLVSINALLEQSSDGYCYLAEKDQGINPLLVYGRAEGSFNALSGSTEFRLPHGVKLQLVCSGPVSSDTVEPSTVSLLRLDRMRSGTALGEARSPRTLTGPR